MKNKLVELVNVSKSFGSTKVLDELCLEVKENEFLTLLGPSGCGKTTTLRIIGGFEKPDSGKVFFDGADITNVPANKRNLNTVFQKYALFGHMTIEENIAFGLKIKNKSDSYIKDKIKYALKLVNLEGFEKRKPTSLSGGQQQRIAIARAIVNEPKVLLLDEPLGALLFSFDLQPIMVQESKLCHLYVNVLDAPMITAWRSFPSHTLQKYKLYLLLTPTSLHLSGSQITLDLIYLYQY